MQLTTLQFLQLVWPEKAHGNYYAIKYGSPPNRAAFFDTIEEAADFAVNASRTGQNVYYCTGQLDSQEVKSENAVLLKELAFDVDAKADADKYNTVDECIAGLKNFCELLSIPLPLIILTGGGIHGHWVFEQPIGRAEHQLLARGLKALARRHNFYLDQATVGNSAQILRPVSTYNYKRDAPFLISVLDGHDSHYVTPDDLKPLTTGQYGYEKTIPLDDGVSQIKLMAAGCLVAKELEKDGGISLSEPAWKGLASNASECIGGDEWFHSHSALDPRYTPHETQKKLDYSRKFKADGGASWTCAQMANHSEACSRCPFLGKITRPLDLAQPAKLEGHEEGEKPIPEEDKVDDRTFNGRTEIVSRKLEITAMATIEGTRKKVYCIHAPYINHKFYMTYKDLISVNDIINEQTGAAIQDQKLFEQWARREMGQAQKVDGGVVAKDFGWNEDCTMLKHGLYQITKDGIIYQPAIAAIEDVAACLKPKGALTKPDWYNDEEWMRHGMEAQVEALSAFFRPGFEHQAVCILASVAGLFWNIIERNQGGLVLSCYGEASGTGKTTAVQAALSLHGQWDQGLMLQQHSSNAHHQEMLALFRHYPVGVDEAYKHDEELFIQFMQQFTTGRPKDRLRRTGELQFRDARWGTIMFHTSNRSSLSILQARADAAAMAERLIEIRFQRLPLATVDNRIMIELKQNCGFFTPLFAWWVLRDNLIPELQRRTYELIEEYNASGDWQHRHRFKVAHLALTRALAELINQMQIIKFDVPAMMEGYARLIRYGNLEIDTLDPIGATVRYIGENMHKIYSAHNIEHMRGVSPIGRLDEARGGVWLAYRPLIAYVQKAGFNTSEFMQDLYAAGKIDSLELQHEQLDASQSGFSMKQEALLFRLEPNELNKTAQKAEALQASRKL